MLWDWLKANLPSYVTILGMQSSSGMAVAPAPAPVPPAAVPAHANPAAAVGLQQFPGMTPATAMPQMPAAVGLHHSLSAGNLAGGFMM